MERHANMIPAAPFRGLMAVRANTDTTSMLQQINAAVVDMKAKQENAIRAIEAEVDRQAAQLSALGLTGGAGHDRGRKPGNMVQEAEAFAGFARTGSHFNAALSTDDIGKGGALVAPAVSNQIQMRQFDQSSLAKIARRVTLQTGDAFEEIWDIGDPGTAWVGEREARPETTNADLKVHTTYLHEVYCLQAITQRLLDDSSYDLGTWLTGRIADKLGRVAGSAFMIGDGVNKPHGLSTYAVAATTDATRPWGTIQGIYTGTSGAFSASVPADVLLNTIYALRSEYRPNASWIMNSLTAGQVRKMKDSTGRFLWTDSLTPGQPPMLLGYPVYLDEYAPDIAANTAAIWFGDFSRAYLIVDRPGLKLLRDPYTSKPNVLFYCYQRIGGTMSNSEAVKAVVFGS